jgi:hypothetical protein
MSLSGPEQPASLVRRQMGNHVRAGHELVRDALKGMGFITYAITARATASGT